MDIGGRIRSARKRAGLSQEEVARRAGMSLKGMSYIEVGRVADPHYSSLVGIADALGMSVGELLEGDPTTPGKAQAPPPPETGDAAGLSPEERREQLLEYAAKFNDLAEKQREDLANTDPNDRRRLMTVFTQAMCAYLGAEEFVEDLDLEGRAGRRVSAAVESIREAAEAVYAVLGAEAETGRGTVTALAEYQRRKRAS